MKHAITGPKGRIFQVLDKPTEQTKEITDEQATIVATGADKLGYWIIDGVFKSGTKIEQDKAEARRLEQAAKQEAQRAEREASRLASMSPEQRAAMEAQAQRKAAYNAAAVVFESLSVGKQAMWEPVRAKVAAAIMAGDMALALEILTTLPSLYDGAEDDRAMFLSLFK